MKKIRNIIIFCIIVVFSRIFCFTWWRLNIFIGWFLGRLFYYFDFKYKYIIFKNLKLIFPNYSYKKIIKITQDCYSNLGKNVFEFFLFPRIKYFLDKIVEFSKQDFELFRNFIEQNKGVVIFSAHFGNWELLGATLALKKLPLAVIAKSVYIKQLNYLVEKLRNSVGELVIGRGEQQSIKKLLSVLRRGYVLGVLIDQNIKNIKNLNIPFLGQIAPTPISFVEMVVKYKIPSVIGLICRLNNNKHKIVVIPLEESLYDDKIKFIEYVNNKISEYIMCYPSEWVWMHNRWNLE